MAFLALHEQDFVFRRLQYLRGLGHRRRVDPVLRIHEEFAARPDRGRGLVHLLADALIHQRFRNMLADRGLVAFAAEISGERLFADDVLAALHGLDDHRSMQVGRRADVDDIDLVVTDNLAVAPISFGDVVAASEIDDMVAARRHGRDLDIDAVNAFVGIHVQLRNEAAAHKSDLDFRHRQVPRGLVKTLVPPI